MHDASRADSKQEPACAWSLLARIGPVDRRGSRNESPDDCAHHCEQHASSERHRASAKKPSIVRRGEGACSGPTTHRRVEERVACAMAAFHAHPRHVLPADCPLTAPVRRVKSPSENRRNAPFTLRWSAFRHHHPLPRAKPCKVLPLALLRSGARPAHPAAGSDCKQADHGTYRLPHTLPEHTRCVPSSL